MDKRRLFDLLFKVLLLLLALAALMALLLPAIGLCRDGLDVAVRNFIVLPGIGKNILATLRLLGWVMLIVTPLSLGMAVWMSEYAMPKSRKRLRRVLELCSWFPSVLLGLLGRLLLTPWLGNGIMGMTVVMALFVLPFLTMRFEIALRTVPKGLRVTGLALGATRPAIICKLLLPSAAWELLRACVMCAERILGEATALLVLLSAIPESSMIPVELVRLTALGRPDAALLALLFGLCLCVLRLLTSKRWDGFNAGLRRGGHKAQWD